MILDRLCPELRELARLMEEKVLRPLQKGEDVVVEVEHAEKLSTQEILEKM